MKYRFIATGILTGSLLSYSSNIFADAHKFPDVPEWANVSVNYLVEKEHCMERQTEFLLQVKQLIVAQQRK